MTKQEFKAPFMGMCELYDKTPSEAVMSIYYEAVKHLDKKTWNQAVHAVISTNKYPSLPKPAEILEATGMNADEDAEGMLAIEKIKQAIREHGPYQSVVFDDPVIHMLIDRHDKGWPGLCELTQDEHKWLFKDWTKLYKAYLRRPVSHSKRLMGVTERDNTPSGLKVNCSACSVNTRQDCKRCNGTGYIDMGRNMVSYVGDKSKCLEIEGDETLQIEGE
jgi:hypothetical protein